MQNVEWPSAAKVAGFSLAIEAHSIGGANRGGHSFFGRGPGARWRGSFDVVQMPTETALQFRAFLHSLRGKGGTFLFALPSSGIGRKSMFSDGTEFTDSTAFSDIWVGGFSGELTADAAKGDDSIIVDSMSASIAVVGGYITLDDPSTGQLLRVVAIDGATLKVRPRLRKAFLSGTAVAVGRPVGKFRLDQDVPAVPLNGQYSSALTVQVIEAF